MQCLYCKKKLGFFASKKRPFCSDQHEVAYNDEQAGLALRRVLDPLFTEPVPKARLQPLPVRTSASPSPSPAGAQGGEDGASTIASFAAPPLPSEGLTSGLDIYRAIGSPEPVATPAPASFQPVVAPPLYPRFFRQAGPPPRSINVVMARPALENEIVPPKPLLPVAFLELVEDGPFEAPPEEAPSEPAAIEVEENLESVAQPAEALLESRYHPDSSQLHPALAQVKPDFLAEEPRLTLPDLAEPLSFPVEPHRAIPLGLSPIVEATPDVEPPPETIAEPGPPAGLLPPEPMASHAAEEASAHSPTVEPALDPPPPALRYPYSTVTARLPGLDATPAAPPAEPAIDWRPRTLPPDVRWADLAVAAPREQVHLPQAALPKPELAIEAAGGLGPVPARAEFELHDLRHHAELAAVRWKVFTGLREAPAKLALPRPAAFPSLSPPPTPAGPVELSAALALPAGAPPLELRTWVSAVKIAAWRGAPDFHQVSMSTCRVLLWRKARPAVEEAPTETALDLPQAPSAKDLRGGLLDNSGLKVGPSAWSPVLPLAQPDRRLRFRPSGLAAELLGYQRIRPASLIQIREPQFAGSSLSELPRGVARMAWRGVGMRREGLAPVSPIPIRPEVRPPSWMV